MKKEKNVSKLLAEATKECGYINAAKLASDLEALMMKLKDHHVVVELRQRYETETQQLICLSPNFKADPHRQVHIKFLLHYPNEGSIAIEAKQEDTQRLVNRLFHLLPTFSFGLFDLVVKLNRDLAKREIKDVQLLQLKVEEKQASIDEEPSNKRARITQVLTLNSLPEDVLSTVFSYLTKDRWWAVASVSKHMNNALLYGHVNSMYRVCYLFGNMISLVHPKNHPKLCKLLDYIAVQNLSLQSRLICKSTQANTTSGWNSNMLLETAKKFPEVFTKHADAIEKLMNISAWNVEFATACTSIPQIYERGMRAFRCFTLAPSVLNSIDMYENKYSTYDGDILVPLFRTRPKKSIWCVLAEIDYDVMNDEIPNWGLLRSSFDAVEQLVSMPVEAALELAALIIDQALVAGLHGTGGSYSQEHAQRTVLVVQDALALKQQHDVRPDLLALLKKLMNKVPQDQLDEVPFPEMLLDDEAYIFSALEVRSKRFKALPAHYRNNKKLAELVLLGEVKTNDGSSSTTGIPFSKYKTTPDGSAVAHLEDLLTDRDFMMQVFTTHPKALETKKGPFRKDGAFLTQLALECPFSLNYCKIKSLGQDPETIGKILDALLAKEDKRLSFLDPTKLSSWMSLAQDESIFFKLQRILKVSQWEAPLMYSHLSKAESPRHFYKKLLCCSPFYIHHFPREDILDLLSEEEQTALIANCLKFRDHLQFLPMSIYNKFKEMITKDVLDRPKALFPVLPPFARADMALCIEVLQKRPSQLQFVSTDIQSDLLQYLQLLNQIPKLIKETPVTFAATAIKDYLTNASVPKIVGSTLAYLDLPAVIRNDPRLRKQLSASTTCRYSSNSIVDEDGNTLLHIEKQDDDEKQPELNKLLWSLAKPYKVLMHNDDDSDDEQKDETDEEEDDEE